MSEEKRFERRHEKPEDIAAILSVVSDKVPSLIKGLVNSVFSEDAARSMAKAASTYYKELKEGGFPEEVALKMTQDYVSVFTKFGNVIKAARESSGSDELKEAFKERTRDEKD